MSQNILVVIEAIDGDVKKSALEAISYGAHIAATWSSENCVLIIGQTDKISVLGRCGAQKVIQVSNTISVADSQAWTNCISEVASQHQASIIIMPQNSSSKSIAGRLSIKLNAGCMIGANSLPVIQGNSMTISRSAFAGKATAYLRSNAPVIITLAQGACPIKNDGGDAVVTQVNADSSPSIKVLEVNRITGKTPLPEADLVVSGGRGLKDPSNWGILEELANALDATTACSRPVADAHWRPHYEHVGQTGIAIKPSLYIAIGISGAIQHLAGVNNSKVIVVINKDPEAPFFKAADYGVCADLFDIVPKLTEEIKKIKSK